MSRILAHLAGRILLVVSVAWLTTGCDLLSPGGSPDLTGTYEGRVRLQRFDWDVRIALAEVEGEVVEGSGWQSPTDFEEVEPFTVYGVYDHPDLTLTIEFSGRRNREYVARVSEDASTLTGVLRGPDRSRELSLVRRNR